MISTNFLLPGAVLQTEECVGGGLGTGLEGGGDIHEEVEAGAGLYGVDGRDYRGLVGGVRLEEVGTAYCCGLDSVVNRVYSLEISQTRQRQHRDGIVSVMNTEGKRITARKRSVLLDY